MNTLKSKLMLLAISLLPMIVLGDLLPRPIYIHRLRRIGYDVLPVPNNDGTTADYGIMVYVAIVLLLLLMGIGLIV